MTNIIADSALVERKLHELLRLCLENGAYFHSEIDIVVEDGQLRVDSKLERSSNEPIIYLPDACLPRIEDFDVTLAGDVLISQPRSGAVSVLHCTLMNMLLELFNLTGKISAHRKTFPWLVFYKHEDILRQLQIGRSVSDKYHELLNQQNQEALTVASFLGARYINYNYNDSHGEKEALMPIIDCLNHHRSAPPYLVGSYAQDVEKGLMVRNSKPVQGSNECFVRYNKADALSAYMSYGFVDNTADILRSIPMTIDLPEVGVIHVHSYTYAKDADHIPSMAGDIKFYFPHVRRTGLRQLQISHLMIPPAEAPMALRRILGILISFLAPHIRKKELKVLVRNSETQVLEQNFQYYKRLRDLLNLRKAGGISAENVAALNQLIRGQLDKLKAYKSRRL